MNKRVLVIDDDLAIRKSFRLALEDSGIELDLADSGDIGIEMIKYNEYDLVYLDLKMPGKNGVETLELIRKNHANIPIYIITAFHQEFFKSLKKASENGVDFEILKKPLEMEQIVSITRRILNEEG